jgi:hypothetical protein
MVQGWCRLLGFTSGNRQSLIQVFNQSFNGEFYRELECMGKVGKLVKYLEKLAWKLAGRAVEA